jgi:hypothetical protein
MKPRERIINALTVMATHWGIAMDGPRMKIYLDALVDLPPGAVEKAVAHLIKTETFGGVLPIVGKIREAAEDYLADEHYLLEGPGQKKVFITLENCHLYADKGCLKCGGRGKTVEELPMWKKQEKMKVFVRCDCVQEPQ